MYTFNQNRYVPKHKNLPEAYSRKNAQNCEMEAHDPTGHTHRTLSKGDIFLLS